MSISNSTHNDNQANEVLREWRANASYWQKHLGTIRTIFQPVTQALIDDVGIVEGQSVLDVAGGAGEPSFTIAQRVGANGSVVCTDVVAEMIAGAQTEAQRRGLTNIRFRQSAADSLPFEDDSFDVVVCRFGIMFFPDPLAALREMLRVTKPAGMIGLAVWGKTELNPFYYLANDVLARHLGPAAPANPDAPAAYRFGEPDSLARVLRQAGANKVTERPLEFHLTAPISPAQFWEMRSETSGTLREKLATMTPPQRNLIAQEVQESVREFFPNNQMSLPAHVIVVTGSKP
jgi:SAM-dependent methyltransferase